MQARKKTKYLFQKRTAALALLVAKIQTFKEGANFRVTFALGLLYLTCSKLSLIKKRITNVLFSEQNWQMKG